LLLPRRILWAVGQGFVALAILTITLIGAARFGLPEGDLRALVFTALVLINMGLILVNQIVLLVPRPGLPPPQSLARHPAWRRERATGRRSLFHFGRLHLDDLATSAGAGLVSLLVLEWLKGRWFRNAPGAHSP
jgi:Ca2+-transporting ATPase